MKKIRQILTSHRKRVFAIALVFAILISSITFLGDTFTDAQTYAKTIESIDEKKTTVLSVSAAIAGSATLLASIPDDSTTPLANEMMDLCSYLVVVVLILVLEKSLLTFFGAISCYVLIPVACCLVLTFIFNNKKVLITWAIKLAVLALALLLIIPVSTRFSDYIYEVNNVSIEEKTEESTEATETDDSDPWYKKLWNSVTEAVKNTVESALESGRKALNNFIDAVSVFVIAYCAIPIFTLFLFLWLLKILFGLNIKIGIKNINPKRREQIEEKTDD